MAGQTSHIDGYLSYTDTKERQLKSYLHNLLTTSVRYAPYMNARPDIQSMYLELLRKHLTRYGEDELVPVWALKHPLMRRGLNLLATKWQLKLARVRPFDEYKRDHGLDWPAAAETMIGMQRLTSLQHCVETVLAEDVPGDLIECGVWRGGACILMRAVLAVYGDEKRCVWLADSFAGVPPPDKDNYAADEGLRLDTYAPVLAVSMATVKANFERYGLLDDRVRFIPGWFRDTLPNAPVDQIAVLRLDGDLYESTIQALSALYPRLSLADSVSSTTIMLSAPVGERSRTTVKNIGYPLRSMK